MPAKNRLRHRLERSRSPSLAGWDGAARHDGRTQPIPDAVVDCGWGRLIFGQTFQESARLAETLKLESPGRRDIAMYLRDPHVVISMAPQELFLDPSHTFRLWLDQYHPGKRRTAGFTVRLLNSLSDAESVHDLYKKRHMVPPDPEFVWEQRKSRALTYLVATDDLSGAVIGAVTGVDHNEAFDDPENGSSLWALAVDPQAQQPGIGETLVRRLAEHSQARGRAFMDLSVMHDNYQAIRLYEKLGFQRVPVFAIKRKNPYNEPLFVADGPEATLNPYARIIVDEARRRGIGVEVLDEEGGYFSLSFGGRTVVCRESLSGAHLRDRHEPLRRQGDDPPGAETVRTQGTRPETGGFARRGPGISRGARERGGQARARRAGGGDQRGRAHPRDAGAGPGHRPPGQ